jgi:hypothetical protein
VSRISPLILDLVMESHDLVNLTSTTIRSALFGRERSLGLSELILHLGAKVLALFEFTIARRNLIHDAEINANFRTSSV